MPAMTRMFGPRNMTATWPMSSAFKARLPKKSPTSFRPGCRQKRKRPWQSGRHLISLPTISTSEQKNSSTTSLTRLAGEENDFKAVQFLDQALARTPDFLLAHCQLSYAHDQLYWFNFDHSETRLALAETNVRAAVRLQPDLGETHLAQAIHFYWGYRSYDRAREELAKAQHALPNNPKSFHFLGLIDRRQGRWEEAIRNFERVVDLDPRNAESIINLGETYSGLRKYGESIEMYDRALALQPRSAILRAYRGSIGVYAQADMTPLRAALNMIEAEGLSSAAEVAQVPFELALRERDPAATTRALAKISSEGYIREAD